MPEGDKESKEINEHFIENSMAFQVLSGQTYHRA